MQRRGLMLGSAAILAGAVGPRARAAAAPVAIELFTSQGCSSCPPADRLLGELARDPSVIALAWHVDYWNGLGWPDPFATRLATDRQRAYARNLGEDVYTPALVVGGARMLIGSNGPGIRAAIQAAAPASVPVAIVPDGAGMAAEVGGAGRPVSALLAFYEPEHLTTVSRGENGGRQLREYRIVRGAQSLGTWDGTPRRLPLPDAPPGLGAAVLVQDADLKVLGSADLRPAYKGG
jgi:hypothetical protein